MEKAETYAKAIKAALAYSGQNRGELARRIGIHLDTLGRKLRRPETFTLGDLIRADREIRFTQFIERRTK